MEPSHTFTNLITIYLAADGSIKAVFDDNTLLVLSSGAETFTHVSGSTGAKTVQLCDFCISRFAPLLHQVLEFRNQHVDVPALPRGLQARLAAGGALFCLGWPITDLCWPQSPEEAFALGLVELPDRNRIAVRSRCSSARIVLEYTGLRFAVRFPLLLQHEPGSSTYTYTWQTQVFSRSQYPPRWQPALAVACAVADNAAAGFSLQQHDQQQAAVLADLSNRPISSRQQLSTPQSPSAAGAGRCSSPKRYGSPLQRQHRAWQEQQQEAASGSPAVAAPAAASPTARHQQQVRHSCSRGSPGRSELLQLQQQPQRPGSPQAAAAAASSADAAAVTQLPISEHVLQSLPPCLRRRQHQQQDEQQQAPAAAAASRIAAALSQALGRGGTGVAAAGAGAGGSWWLQPSLLLPSDQLLQMVWTPDATMLFIHEVEEVEVWLHADDSCLFSHGAGAFVTHLQPAAAAAAWDGKLPASPPPAAAAAAGQARAAPPVVAGEQLYHSQGLSQLLLTASPADASAAHQREQQQQQAACDAAGLIEGLIDGSEMSRVYAASALPEEPVAGVAAAGAGGVVQVPLGRLAAQALKFRSTEARVKRCLATQDAQPSPPAAGAAATAGLSQLALTPVPREQQQQQQQQQQQPLLSNDVTEEQDVPGVGRFVATADGRVRVLFADRTILNLSADQRHLSVLLPDGSQRTVLADHPLGVEEYAQAALEFAAWSRTTPEQRAAALRMQALVAAELRGSARMAAICEWGSSAQLPAGAAAAALHQPPSSRAGGAGADLLQGWWQEADGAEQGQGEAALDDEGDCEGYCWPVQQQHEQPAEASGGAHASMFGWLGGVAAAGGCRDSSGAWSDGDDGGGGSDPAGAAPPGWSSRRAAVADMLEANARLLARLQV